MKVLKKCCYCGSRFHQVKIQLIGDNYYHPSCFDQELRVQNYRKLNQPKLTTKYAQRKSKNGEKLINLIRRIRK